MNPQRRRLKVQSSLPPQGRPATASKCPNAHVSVAWAAPAVREFATRCGPVLADRDFCTFCTFCCWVSVCWVLSRFQPTLVQCVSSSDETLQGARTPRQRKGFGTSLGA